MRPFLEIWAMMCLLGMAGGWSADLSAQQTLHAVAGTCVHQSHPNTVYENDLISFWSGDSANHPSFGGLHDGLTTFDLSSLAGQTTCEVELRPFPIGWARLDTPADQTVSIAPGTAAGVTANTHLATRAPQAIPLEGLRHGPGGSEGFTCIMGSPTFGHEVVTRRRRPSSVSRTHTLA